MAPNDTLRFTSFAQGWVSACIARLPEITQVPLPSGLELVDKSGHLMSEFNKSTWGITYETCARFCDRGQIPLGSLFRFQDFANSFTNYLLPWLALTAQLTYETGSPFSNFISFCMAVGSPALVTYSLTLTILNRYWVRCKYQKLKKIANDDAVKKKYPEYYERVEAIEYLLSYGQQVPLRASQEKGWLSSLIVDPDNQDWWTNLQANLHKTRRRVTYSLLAQVSSAIIAWFFVVGSTFEASLGSAEVALQISSGSLWAWLLPVIGGWIIAQTQNDNGTISDAMNENKASYAAAAPRQQTGRGMVTRKQRGIRTTSDPIPQFTRTPTSTDRFEIEEPKLRNKPEWWGADVRGDETEEGPIYNYARIFTWFQFNRCLTRAVEATLENIEHGHAVQKQVPLVDLTNGHTDPQTSHQPAESESWAPWSDVSVEENLNGDAEELAHYCRLTQPGGNIRAYIPLHEFWQDSEVNVFGHIASAGAVALLVQWGTAGAAIAIAYLTPTIGLGCRSGSYVLYGVLGTLVWALTVASMSLSHWAMILYQDSPRNSPSRSFLDPRYRTPGHSFLCAAAVITRTVGKLLAIANAAWIVVSSIFEFIGFYDSCWCEGNQLTLGKNGWVLLFKGPPALKEAAKSYWVGGTVLSTVTCVASFFLLLSASRGTVDSR